MVTPALSEFISLARDGRTTPLRRRIPADLETPVSVYLKLAPLGANCLLESVERGIQVGRYSFIGLAPRLDLGLEGDEVFRRIDGQETRSPVDPEDPLADLREELDRASAMNAPDLPGPLGAAVGYLGWDMVRYFENLTLPDGVGPELPDYRFMFPSGLVVFDHVRSEIEIAVLPADGDPEPGYNDALDRLHAVIDALRGPLPANEATPGPKPGHKLGDGPAGSRFETPRAEFEASVDRTVHEKAIAVFDAAKDREVGILWEMAETRSVSLRGVLIKLQTWEDNEGDEREAAKSVRESAFADLRRLAGQG